MNRWRSTCLNDHSLNLAQLQDFRLQNKWGLAAISRKKISDTLSEEEPSENGVILKKRTTRNSKRATTRTRKKISDVPDENSELGITTDATNEEVVKKTPRRTRRKATSPATIVEEEKTEKKIRRRRTEKMDENMKGQGSESEISDMEESAFVPNVEDESDGDLELDKDVEMILATRMGGSAGSVAIALASLGGKVALMGKLGDDEFGQAMLYYLNVNNVQTRSVRIDSKRATALSQMKIAKRGHLRMTCVKPCAEDSLSKSEINIDVLKEAKMLYFNTHSLLDRSMQSATLRAIKMSKKLGGVVFYDVNLPLPLWQSSEETKLFIQEVWNHANVIELTKQELEFLCGIEPTEEFDTKNNARSKFVHYGPEVVAPLWHENLKVLFVTNGTSKIHYYTEEHNGAVHGMEDAPITPLHVICQHLEMALLQPHLITDKGYLEQTVKYAINCGVIDQWLLGRMRDFPPKEYMEEVEPDPNGIMSITEKEYRTLEPVS
ncbi:hypothetical protein GH714_029649 [Hevea brasiliensis]|uniref:Carbohydrate kinase PfkB domain-containing protein n=1 Tax=Hevea brasiliensis TaxID=3981 RepID=A0A6A6L0R9_HEVBR|nr:hypothetical protein GH714_029649 [Hevea brasiliensis]